MSDESAPPSEVERSLTARITELEQKLEASRALHEATIASLPFDFWARDSEGYCFSQNATTLANWGDLLNKRPEDMALPEAVIEIWLANNRRALAGEVVTRDQEYTLAGETHYVHNILAPIRMADAIVGTLGVNIDITERRQAIQALRENEEKLRMAVEAAGLGLWRWNLHRDELVCEAPLCTIFATSIERAPRDHAAFLALAHVDDRARVGEQFMPGAASGRRELEFRIVRPDGEVRWVLSKSTVFDGEERGIVVGAVIDVTDRHLQDERLREAQKLDAVGQLTAGIAHNFNNMLMGIIPYLEMALRRAPAELSPMLRAAELSAQRAADLVRQLMLYAGRNRPRDRQIESIRALVERAVQLCRATFDGSITIDLHDGPELEALVDATQIEQAVLNILLNARDAVVTSDVGAPRIDVSVSLVAAHSPELETRERDHICVQIADNGIGMDASTAARVFEPFFTTKEVGKGTGLGLAMTHTILSEHGGWIRCDSVPGRGTTFRTYLPCDAIRPSHPPVPEPALVGGTELILVVDDEAPIREVVAQILEEAGYATKLAATGEAAIELLADPARAAEVALVLLDVSMPGMPRRELRNQIRALAPRAHVLYFTGYAFEPDDGDSVLMKPVRTEPLLRGVREAIDRAKTPVR